MAKLKVKKADPNSKARKAFGLSSPAKKGASKVSVPHPKIDGAQDRLGMVSTTGGNISKKKKLPKSSGKSGGGGIGPKAKK